MSSQAQHPLAWSQSGDPIELPESAALWRVRRLNAGPKGGAPEMVYGADGLPLLVEISAGPQDLAEAVEGRPGKYRLDALDESRKAIPDVPPAYVVVQGKAREEQAAAAPDHLARAFEVIERMTKTLAEAMDRQSSQMATLVEASARLLGAADRAGITRRNEAAPVVAPAPQPHPPAPAPGPVPTPAPSAPAAVEQAEAPEPPPSVLDRVDHWIELAMPFVGPMLPQIGMALMRKMAPSLVAPPPAVASASPPAAPAPSTSPVSTPPTPAPVPAVSDAVAASAEGGAS